MISRFSGQGLRVESDLPLRIAPGGNHRVTVNLVAREGFEGSRLLIKTNQTEPVEREVEILAQLQARPAAEEQRALTVQGQVKGERGGEIEVTATWGEVSQQQRLSPSSDSYRLTLLRMPSTTNPQELLAGDSLDRLYLRVRRAASGELLLEKEREIGWEEGRVGLVIEELQIVLKPQLEVVSMLDFGPVYAGLVSQRQLEVGNSGNGSW